MGETGEADIKKKVEMEANETRDKIKNEIKAINSKGDSESDDRRKEIAAMKNQIQKDREELRGQLENDTSMVLKQLEKDSGDIMGLIKKEKSDRQRDVEVLHDRVDNERKEMQILI